MKIRPVGAELFRTDRKDEAISHYFLEITNLTHFLCIYLFHVSTCFERHSAHHQEVELY